MPNDFDHIGVRIRSAEEFGRFIASSTGRGTAFPTPVGGSYERLGGADGGEFWVQRGPTGEPLGGHPHFTGSSRFNLKVSEVLDFSRVKGTPLDGALMCVLVDDQPDVPLMVDVPDFRMYAAWLAPETSIVVQLCAFPRDVVCEKDEAAFASTPLGSLSPNGALIPSGLFIPGGGPKVPPQSDAIFAGRVESCREVRSALGGQPFYAIALRTLGGTVDIPLSPESVPTVPDAGWIIAGSFAMSGRVLSPLPSAPAGVMERAHREAAAMRAGSPNKPPEKKSLLGRLFGR